MTVTAVGEPATSQPPRRRRRRHGRKMAGALLTIVLATALAGGWLVLGERRSSADDPGSGRPPNTAPVTRQTLQDTHTADGRLGYGTVRTATDRLPGTLTALPATGTTVSRGKPLYKVDDKAVILMYGIVPAYRDLTVGADGPDVAQLESNLSALGYSGFTVDDEYTDSTAAAVAEWQAGQGLDETGTVRLGQVIFAPAAVRVDGHRAAVGDPTGPGRPVLTYTGTRKEVTVNLDSSDQRLAERGAAVDVRLPDGSVLDGKIADYTTVIEPASAQGEDPKTTIEVTIALADQKATDAYVLASVDVTFMAEERKNVLTVPVTALLALNDGGFGVEVVEDDASRYVPVKTGLFSGGRVEITGEGITDRTIVGVPK